MIDTGHNDSYCWRPSRHFRGKEIEWLVISNFDEDHVSDFGNVLESCYVNTIVQNPTITSNVLYKLKNGFLGMGTGIKAVYAWLQKIKNPILSVPIVMPDFAGVQLSFHWNEYGNFTDTNNLSLVTFVHYGNFTILFPGDLEKAGWRELLKYKAFRNELKRVTVLVAAHHGRENGCCDEVFNFCSPRIVIISDARKQYDTQETSNWYGNRVYGYNTIGGEKRKVLTTRKDGKITIYIPQINHPWHIAREWEKKSLPMGAWYE